MTAVWIIVVIFIVFAIVYGGTQLFAALADRRRAREVIHDDTRTDPQDRPGDGRR